MGFLRRFLSMGSRKGKKNRNQLTSASTPGLENIAPTNSRKEEREQEAAASRLLRSSSAHFTVVSEVDYTSLPPLPHPINSLSPTPNGSSSLSPTPTGNSLYSLTPSASPSRSTVQSRGRTYSVKILGRQVHTKPEFNEADLPPRTPSRVSGSSAQQADVHPAITPRDENRIHRLRQDPSVASLLDMYDRHGQLDSAVFSNSPEKKRRRGGDEEEEHVGRAQVQRSGSTLRQLLGQREPGVGNRASSSSDEGDISWAERFIQESGTDTPSMPSDVDSPLVDTPKDNVYTMSVDPPKPLTDFNLTFSTEADGTIDCSALNSLEVEYSRTSDDEKAALGLPLRPTTPATPVRPASEVFGFLLERRKSKSSTATALFNTQEPDERSLPPLPTGSSVWSAKSTATLVPPEQSSPAHSAANTSLSTDAPSSAGSILEDPPTRAQIVTQARTPTPVLLAQAQSQRAVEVRQSRIPRGPRPQSAGHSKTRSTGSVLLGELDAQSTGASESALPPPPPPSAAVAVEAPVAVQFKTPVKAGSRLPAAQRDALRSGGANVMTPHGQGQTKTPLGRGQPKALVGLGFSHRQPADCEPYTPVPQRRVASASSARSVDSAKSRRSRIPRQSQTKENAPERRPQTPDARTLFAGARDADPDRSAELSPVAQRMMADLRERRKPARAAEQMAEFVLPMPR